MNSQPVSRRARAALALTVVLPAALALSACNPVSPDKIASPTPSGSHLAAAHEATAPASASESASPEASASETAQPTLDGWTWADGSPVVPAEGAVRTAPEPDTSMLVESKDDWGLWANAVFTSTGQPLDVYTTGGMAKLVSTTGLVTVIDGKIASPFASGHDPFEGNAKALAALPTFDVGDPLPVGLKDRMWPVEVAPDQDGGFVFAASNAPVDSAGSGTPGGTITLYAVDKIGGVPRELGVALRTDGDSTVYSGGLRVGTDAQGEPAVSWQVGSAPDGLSEWSLPLAGGTAHAALKNGVGLGYVKGEPYGLALASDGSDQITAFGPVKDGKVIPLLRFAQDDTSGVFPSGFTAEGDVVTFPDLGVSLNVATKAVTIDSKAYEAARG